MVSKEILKQYGDLKHEIRETREKTERLSNDISRLDREISEMEQDGYEVIDRVKGGEGGNVPFTIKGFPYPEYERKKSQLLQKRVLLLHRKETVELLEMELLEKTNEVESFINSISDSRTRRLVNLRVVNGMSWTEVAIKMGGGNTENTVKKAYQRFLDEKIC